MMRTTSPAISNRASLISQHLVVSPHANLAIPSAVDPPPVGAGRHLGRHVKRALTFERRLAAWVVVCSACRDRRRTGWLSATTHGPQPADGTTAIPEPERPRRRHALVRVPRPASRRGFWRPGRSLPRRGPAADESALSISECRLVARPEF